MFYADAAACVVSVQGFRGRGAARPEGSPYRRSNVSWWDDHGHTLDRLHALRYCFFSMGNRTTVSVVRQESYDRGLADALTNVLDGVGGISAYVKRGQSVLIKPNLLTDRTPEAAVTTLIGHSPT